ncbi:hypothetical protein [Pseudomonas putida]|uniref:hypothetical protein n=1 Tax=Pseudomonas putida TaxID=303 RepID=UPI001F519BB2|nr:hypothetical protein [Pseudomonas putida]MCI0913326.1 hypothetical protein [Pseudomonas putida]
MAAEYNWVLVLGAVLSLMAATLHVVAIIMGPSGYRLFGAGERFVRAAEKGKIHPPLITLAIALVLVSWAAYALSGAGIIRPLPLLRPTLVGVTLVYLVRGLIGPFFLAGTGRTIQFIAVSSAVCTLFGLVHLVGVIQIGS